MHLIPMHLIQFWVSWYELSSDDDEPPLQPDDPADGGSALDDMQPQIGPPTLRQPPAPIPSDFAAFIRRTDGNTTAWLATIREADAYLPPGPIVVYSEYFFIIYFALYVKYDEYVHKHFFWHILHSYSFRWKHDCVVPVTPYLAGVFNYLRLHIKIPPKVRAIDMRHILLLLPLFLDGLLADEVLEHNRLHPLNPALDPSSELIGITLIFIQWYNLYRRRCPPKDEPVRRGRYPGFFHPGWQVWIYSTYFEYREF